MTRVVIYDSGVGGLSIYQELRAANPNFEYVFVSDNNAYPYGIKAEAELLARISEVGLAIYQNYQPDILVLACNTASTIGLPSLREMLNIPVVGVVPAIKPAAALSQSKVIGMLATPATVKRNYTTKLIKDFAADCDVIKVGSRELVDMAEAKLSGELLNYEQLSAELQPFIKHEKLDVLVLACTHFPFLKKEIAKFFEEKSRSVLLVDSGSAIAKRVSSLGLESSSQMVVEPQLQIAVFTRDLGEGADSCAFKSNLKKMGFDRIEFLKI